MNAYTQVDFIRDLIDEPVASHWSTLNLLRRLNLAQGKIALKLAMTPGDWLTKSASVTVTNSIGTLPVDCSKPIYMEDSKGNPINWLIGGPTYRQVTRGVTTYVDTTAQEAYILHNTFETNSDSFSDTITLWYQRRVPDLHMGFTPTGGASSLKFDVSTTEAVASNTYGTGKGIKFINDYYNDVTVDIYAGSGIQDIRTTISDWDAATAVATVTGTPSNNDIYGTVSVLPEECHMLMTFDAAIMALIKPGAKLDKEALQYVQSEYRRAKQEFDDWISTRVHGGMAVGRA